MKIFLTIFLLFFYKFGYAKVGDVYYCVEKYVRGVDLNSEPKEKNYILKNFTFKRYDDRLVFNTSGDNSWVGYTMNYVIDYVNAPELYETFRAFREKEDTIDILRYENGNFLYAMVANNKSTYTYAECSIF